MSLVGKIVPGERGGKPLFKIIRRDDDPMEPAIRECDHPQFVLDERWGTVTCTECKARVDPFHALLNHAVWYERMQHAAGWNQETERRVYRALLRQLADRRALTDGERSEIAEAITRSSCDPKDLETLHRRLSGVLRDRKNEKRRRARPPPSAGR